MPCKTALWISLLIMCFSLLGAQTLHRLCAHDPLPWLDKAPGLIRTTSFLVLAVNGWIFVRVKGSWREIAVLRHMRHTQTPTRTPPYSAPPRRLFCTIYERLRRRRQTWVHPALTGTALHFWP